MLLEGKSIFSPLSALHSPLVDSFIMAGVLSSDPPEILFEPTTEILFDGIPEVVRPAGTCSNKHNRYVLEVTKVISHAP